MILNIFGFSPEKLFFLDVFYKSRMVARLGAVVEELTPKNRLFNVRKL